MPSSEMGTGGQPCGSGDVCRLAAAAESIPGGVCEIALDGMFTLLCANRFFYVMFGFTREQLKEELENRLQRLIWPPDLPGLRRAIEESMARGDQGFEAEHRIQRRDGTVFWALVRGSFSRDRKSAFCVAMDITGRKAMEEALRVNEERFRLALAQTDSTIFDYDLRSRRMLHADKAAERYGLEAVTEDVPDSLVRRGVIHRDSVGEFMEMYRRIRTGAQKASCAVRTRLASGEYVWRRISMTNVFDGDGNAVRAIGFLEDIDDQKRREQDLLERSERDALTGLYNRGATEAHVSEYLRAARDAMHALMIVDIDAFKSVNDQHGHPFGDLTLAESARRISELFHTSDVIGRIGGDEFIVFMKNLRGPAIVKKRARELCSAFSEAFVFGGETAYISCSVGIAVSPRDGETFACLYQKADIALYGAKKAGKNNFRIFQPDMDPGTTWTPYSSSAIDAPDGEGNP